MVVFNIMTLYFVMTSISVRTSVYRMSIITHMLHIRSFIYQSRYMNGINDSIVKRTLYVVVW